MLSGHRILGKIKCYQGGHLLTNMFLRKLFGEANVLKFKKIENLELSEKLSQKTQEKMAVIA